MGWILGGRQGNAGSVGNTIEDLLEVKENNLPLANAGEWEIKAQREGNASLTTLLHCEPSRTALKFVPQILLPKYGWVHKLAGTQYPAVEMSFRQTIVGSNRTDRGFAIVSDTKTKRVVVSFDSITVDERHAAWLASVKKRVGLDELNPQPYWGFDDLSSKLRAKLHNTFYAKAEVKREKGKEYFRYAVIEMLSSFDFEKFLDAIEAGAVAVDFDARTGHNHGTKFRLKQNWLPALYAKSVHL